MYHLDLFSGIGGFALACDWAGIETIGFVEIDKYCQKVLRKHWPDVPIVEDIRDVKAIKEIVANATELRLGDKEDKRELEGTGSRELHIEQPRIMEATRGRTNGESPAILVTAGFPCQPFSVAGKRGGDTDDRYLWPETLAVIEAIKPAWVLLENVAGIIPMALDTVLSDLEGAGYSYETLIIPACAVNAWHRRDRVWIVAYAQCCGCDSGEYRLPRGTDTASGSNNEASEQDGTRQGFRFGKAGQDAADTQRTGLEGADPERDSCPTGQPVQPCEDVADTTDGQPRGVGAQCDVGRLENEVLRGGRDPDYWAVEPELGRVAYELPPGMDGGRLDDQVGDTQAITENLQFAWEVLREMWDNQEFTETPSKLRQQPIPGVMYDLPYRGRPTLWHSPKETNQELYSLWGRVCASSFQEAQHLLPSLLEQIGQAQRNEAVASIYDAEPAIPRVAAGVKNRVDRLKCLGNAIVPQVAYEIIRVIKEIERA